MNIKATLPLPSTFAPQSNARWRPRASSLRVRVVIYLLLIDLLCISVGFLAAASIRTSLLGRPQWALLLITLLPVYVFIAFNSHAYSTAALQAPSAAIRRGLKSLLIAVAAVIFIGFSFKTSENFPRLVTAIGLVLGGGLMTIARYFYARHLEAIVGGNPFSVVLIRDGDMNPPSGRFSVMVAADANLDPQSDDPVMYDRLARMLQGADRVVVSCPPERRTAWAHALKGACIQGEIVIPELAVLEPLGVSRDLEAPTLIVAAGALDWFDRIVKRAFDLTLSLVALLVLLPVLAIVAIAIKWDSKGPVLFSQIRIGRGNEMFKVLKFRSMYDNLADSAGHHSAKRGDQRITRVGRIIRATSIDELPQLFNIVKGDMSIVGPRPHALGSRAADKLFWEVDQRYWHRHAAKPGLTGLAQVRGYRGATAEESDLRDRLQSDLEYLKNWSIWRDVRIIVLTFRVLLHRNAF